MTNDNPASVRVDDDATPNPTESPSRNHQVSDTRSPPTADRPGASEYVRLRNGMRVDRLLFDAVRLQVEADLHLLAPGGSRFARDLCGRPFWRQLDWQDRPMAGRCLAHLVATGRVDLVFARRRPSYPLRYMRKPHKRIVFGASR
jgi:hypothetical protein